MRPLCLLLAVFVSTPGLSAQAQATTLAELAARAERVVRARILTVDVADGTIAVRFRAQEWLDAEGPATFVLTEPAGRACGRALHGLAVGTGHLVFLTQRAGAPVLASPDSRSIVGLTPGLLGHVRRLRNASATGRVEELARVLADPCPRMRADAALALQAAPGVERAGARARARIVAALARGLSEQSGEVAALIGAAARVRDEAGLDLLLPAYLGAGAPGLDRALRAAIASFAPEDVSRRLAASSIQAHPRRIVALADELEPRTASTLLLALAAGVDPGAGADATQALLRRGAEPATLRRLGVSSATLTRASARASPTNRFRSIDLDRSR